MRAIVIAGTLPKKSIFFSPISRLVSSDPHLKAESISLQKLGLNEPLRIIISMRVENTPKTLAKGTNISP
jgi:hypothetical protein